MVNTEVQHDVHSPEEVLALYRAHHGTLTDMVASRAEADPGRTMLVDRGQTWTWAQGIADAARLASQLLTLGVVPGDRVAVLAPNSGWHVLALLAAARIGAILVPLNPDLREAELEYMLRTADPRVVLAAPDLHAVAAPLVAAESVSIRSLGTDLLAADPFTEDLGTPESGCVIIFTSGTTGFPKGAVHSQQTVVLAGESFVGRVRLQQHDRALAILPLFHVNAMFYSVAGSLAAGSTLVIESRFSASRFWSIVREHSITQTNMIEAVGAILLKRPDGEYVPGHSLRKIYGIRQSLAEAFRARFGVPHLVGGYGMTEIPGVLATGYDEPTPEGAMGKLAAHPGWESPLAECRIVRDGKDVPVGQTGEMWVRTPTLTLGYFRNPVQSAAALDGDWFRTGDLVRRDDEGRYFFVARDKDIIRCRGENISGAELDRVIAAHPDVVIAAAVGVPSDLGDEDILVALTVREGARLSVEDVIGHARDNLAAIKVPRYVRITDELPLTSTGKVAKHLLKNDSSLLNAAVDTRASAPSTPAGK